EDTRLILRALLTHRGFEMLEAESAEEMLERLEMVAPDLIVLDVRLPGMDGCQALQQLRSDGFSKPIFLFSEYYDLFSERILTCRPDAFFPKSKGPVPLIKGIEDKLSVSPEH
ncbi:MAG TPA: response regulator, partial [Longimicrobiales bacterium]